MRNRSLFATVLRASCWAADALLVAFAVYLAIRHGGDLSVNIALALGLCVFLGGLLPLGVYLIDYLFAQNERLMVEAQAPENLRDALIRLEQLTRRVEDASESAAKTTLVARQVPDRLEEKLGVMEEAAARLRPESLENVAVGMGGLAQRLQDLTKDWESLKASLRAASTDDSEVLQRLGRHLPALERLLDANVEGGGSALPGLVASVERLRGEVAALRVLLEPGGEGSGHAPAEDAGHAPLSPAVAPALGAIAPVPDEADVLEDDWVEEPEAFTGDFLDEAPEAEGFDDPLAEEIATAQEAVGLESEASAPGSEELEDEIEQAPVNQVRNAPSGASESPSAPSTKAKTAASPRKAGKSRSKDNELSLFAPAEMEAKAYPPQIPAGRAVLVAKAMIGISNRLFVRGDAPLSWEEGRPLSLSGIGEWRLEIEIDEPVQCELRINDEDSARGELITLQPGELIAAQPKF